MCEIVTTASGASDRGKTNRMPNQKKFLEQLADFPAFLRIAIKFGGVVLVSMMFGFFPEAELGSSLYGNTGLQAISPFTTVCAGLLGFMVASRWHDRDSVWVWIPGVLWFAMGVYETGWQMGAAPSNYISVAVANLFGPRNKCAESECLYELLVTAPLMCSIIYSFVTWLTLKFRPHPVSAG
jgi:hypothetical protein